jgi:hypothetical protein
MLVSCGCSSRRRAGEAARAQGAGHERVGTWRQGCLTSRRHGPNDSGTPQGAGGLHTLPLVPIGLVGRARRAHEGRLRRAPRLLIEPLTAGLPAKWRQNRASRAVSCFRSRRPCVVRRDHLIHFSARATAAIASHRNGSSRRDDGQVYPARACESAVGCRSRNSWCQLQWRLTSHQLRSKMHSLSPPDSRTSGAGSSRRSSQTSSA